MGKDKFGLRVHIDFNLFRIVEKALIFIFIFIFIFSVFNLFRIVAKALIFLFFILVFCTLEGKHVIYHICQEYKVLFFSYSYVIFNVGIM